MDLFQPLARSSAEEAKVTDFDKTFEETHQLPTAEIELYGALVHVTAPGIRTFQAEVASILEQSGLMSVIEPSLEDVFIAYMKA